MTISAYNKIHYEGVIAPNSFPDHLALCAIWHNSGHSPLQRFRFTELGCGDGANLLPLAFYHRDSTFIGIDSSESALKRAQEGARTIGLRNVQLLNKDICEIEPAELAPSDYIVVHGLYSWVTEDARNAILNICGKKLSNKGLAYISYNAQPGWATRSIVRETLRRSTKVQEASLEQKSEQATKIASQILDDLPSRDYAFAALLAEELERVRDGKPFYVFHEYLTEFNEGFWLRDFVGNARQYGLRYVGDAQFCRWEGQIPKDLRDELSQRDLDPIEQEETADLLCHRYFHASVLSRDGAPREIMSHKDILERVSMATSLCAESDPFDLTEKVVERFIENHGQVVTLDTAITKAAVVLLAAQWPAGMKLEALYQQASALLIQYGCDVMGDARAQLMDELTTLFEAGVIDVRLTEPGGNKTASEYPKIHALARYEIEHREALTTPYHMPLTLNDDMLKIAGVMNGCKSAKELRQLYGAEIVDQTISTLGRWGLLE